MSKTTDNVVWEVESREIYHKDDSDYDSWRKKEQECEQCGSIVPNINHLVCEYSEKYVDFFWICNTCVTENALED